MKIYIIAIIFILGITPSFDGNLITVVIEVKAQALGGEWWGDQDDCSIDELFCLVCNDCYDSYTNSFCPTCCTQICDECNSEYSCNGTHTCKDEGPDVPKWCTICHSTHKGFCPKGDICWKCGLYIAECICRLLGK